MKILVLQHVPFEGPASIEDWAAMRSHQLEYCNLYQQDTLPALDGVDLLLVLGGPMGVHDEADYPWLANEKRYIANAIDQGKHVLGLCLGAQLIAHVLGADVSRNEHREIGWFELESQGVHPLARHFDQVNAFHWHGDTFAIPDGAVHLASSEACANQAFIYLDRVLGLQFHLEFLPQVVRRLIEHCPEDLEPGPYVQEAEKMLSQPARFARLNTALYRLLDDWLGGR